MSEANASKVPAGSKTCHVCGALAAHQCDAEVSDRLRGDGRLIATCDRYLCGTHARKGVSAVGSPQYFCPEHVNDPPGDLIVSPGR